tara:strand:- start:34 stop:405 length:372 start_codon:yes stop_codon:yes gene_type:complete
MYKITETVISLLLMVGGFEISKKFSDTFYEIHLKSGEILNVKINKNNNYSCPIECGAFHYHSTLINKSDKNNYTMKFENENNLITINNDLISSIYVINQKMDKKGTSKDQKTKVSFRSFILKY